MCSSASAIHAKQTISAALPRRELSLLAAIGFQGNPKLGDLVRRWRIHQVSQRATTADQERPPALSWWLPSAFERHPTKSLTTDGRRQTMHGPPDRVPIGTFDQFWSSFARN